MTFYIFVRIFYFYSLLVISSSQPTNVADDGWGPYSLAERTYDAVYTHSEEPYSGQYKTSIPQRYDHPDSGYHAKGSYPYHLPSPESYFRGRERTLLPKQAHTQEEADTDTLNRRTIEIGESGPQSLGGQRKGPTGGKGQGQLCGDETKNGAPDEGTSKNVTLKSDFVFPDQLKYIPKTTCGTTYCETMGNDYPKDHIKRILRQEGERFKAVSGRDSILFDQDLSQRIFPEETDLCVSTTRVIFPRKAKTKDNNWLFVINHDGFMQGIGVETCVNAGKPCKMTEGFPLGYRTSCKQKYITRRLLSLNVTGNLSMNEFLIPSCCVCSVRSVGLASRTRPRG